MGRYYKTSKPEMVDFMYKVPEQAILTAIKGVDSQLDTQTQYLTDLKKYLDANVHASDEARKKEILSEAEKKIKDFTLNLHSNPLAALNQMSEIRSFGQDLHENYTRGELGNMIMMKKAEDDWVAQEVERTQKETGKVLASDIEKFKTIFRNKYNLPEYDANGQFIGYKGGLKWDPVEKKGRNVYASERMANFVDAETVVKKKLGDSWAADGFDFTNSQVKGNYIVDSRTGKEYVSYNEVLDSAKNAFLSDKETTEYYNQQIKHGLMKYEDVYGLQEKDENGNPTGRLVPRMIQDEKTGEMVEAKDAYGNIIPLNGGIIHNIAVNQARRIGFNKEFGGVTGMKETEAYKQQLALDKDKAMWDYQHPVVGIDVNGNVEVQVNEGTSFEELNKILDIKTKDIEKQGNDYIGSLTDHLKKANPAAVPIVTAAFEKAKKENTSAAWDAFEKAVTNSGVGLPITVNGQTVNFGTGVKEYVNNVKALNVEKTNAQQYLNQVGYDVTMDWISKMEGTEANRYKNRLIEAKKEGREAEEVMKITAELSTNIGYIQDLNARIAKDNSKTQKVTFLGGGEITSAYGDEGEINLVKRQLNELSKNPMLIFSMISSNVDMVATEVVSDPMSLNKNKTITRPINIEQELNNYGFTTSKIISSEQSGETLISADGKWQLATSSVTISPHDLKLAGRDLGINSKRIVIELKKVGSTTGEKKHLEVIVSGKDVKFTPEIEGVMYRASADAAARDMETKFDAQRKESKYINPDVYRECSYGTDSKIYADGRWVIDGKVYMGEEGRKMYVKKLENGPLAPSAQNFNTKLQVGGGVSHSSLRIGSGN